MGLVKDESNLNILRWLDETPVSYMNWISHEPDSSNICIGLVSLEYFDARCNDSKLFICEMGMYFILVYSFTGWLRCSKAAI